jgi:hypothetical protein
VTLEGCSEVRALFDFDPSAGQLLQNQIGSIPSSFDHKKAALDINASFWLR